MSELKKRGRFTGTPQEGVSNLSLRKFCCTFTRTRRLHEGRPKRISYQPLEFRVTGKEMSLAVTPEPLIIPE